MSAKHDQWFIAVVGGMVSHPRDIRFSPFPKGGGPPLFFVNPTDRGVFTEEVVHALTTIYNKVTGEAHPTISFDGRLGRLG